MIFNKQIYLLFIIIHSFCFSQTDIEIYIDTNKAYIGDIIQIQYDVISNQNIIWPDIQNDISPIEIQNINDIDTLKEGEIFRYSQKFNIQQFDSGRFILPSLKFIQINGDTFYSDSLEYEFLNVPLDSNNVIYDIKEPKKVPFHISEAKPFIIGFIIILLSILLIIFIIRKLGQNNYKEKQFTSIVPCNEEAISALQSLEKEKLYEKGKPKEHYLKLTAILKHYFDRQYIIESMESTSSETIKLLSKMNLDSNLIKDISELLIESDLIKFAKLIPNSKEHKNMMNRSFDIVNKCHLMVTKKESKDND